MQVFDQPKRFMMKWNPMFSPVADLSAHFFPTPAGSEGEGRLPLGIQSCHADRQPLPPRNKGKQPRWASEPSQGCLEGSFLTQSCITPPGRRTQLFPVVPPSTSVYGPLSCPSTTRVGSALRAGRIVACGWVARGGG